MELLHLFISSYLLWDSKRYLPPAVCRFRDYLLPEASVLADDTTP